MIKSVNTMFMSTYPQGIQLHFDIAPIHRKDRIGGVYSGVYSVTSRWGEYSNPRCFSGKLGMDKGPFGAYPKLYTANHG